MTASTAPLLQSRKHHIEKCPRCSQCKWTPAPKSQQFAPICPSIQYGNFHSYSGSGKGITAYALAEERIPVTDELMRSVYACTACGACDTACRTNVGDNVEPLDTIYALREHLVGEGHALPVHQEMVQNLLTHSNAKGLPSEERGAFGRALGLPEADGRPIDVLLIVGSSLAYDQAQWPHYKAIFDALAGSGLTIATLGNDESDSGGLAFDLGFVKEARQIAESLSQKAAKSGAASIVTLDAEGYAAFKGIYPRLGVSLGDAKLLHFTEWLCELIDSGALNLKPGKVGKVTYHDPCKLGRLSEAYTPWSGGQRKVFNVVDIYDPPKPPRFGTGGCYDAPRKLLSAIGAELVEMERVREYGYCCGGGGGAKEAYPDFGEKTGSDRLDEALATDAKTLVTACSGCTGQLAGSANARGAAIKVANLVELVAASVSAAGRG